MVAVNEKSTHGSEACRRRMRPMVDNPYQGMIMRAVRGMKKQLAVPGVVPLSVSAKGLETREPDPPPGNQVSATPPELMEGAGGPLGEPRRWRLRQIKGCEWFSGYRRYWNSGARRAR